MKTPKSEEVKKLGGLATSQISQNGPVTVHTLKCALAVPYVHVPLCTWAAHHVACTVHHTYVSGTVFRISEQEITGAANYWIRIGRLLQ